MRAGYACERANEREREREREKEAEGRERERRNTGKLHRRGEKGRDFINIP
jgi:hypothetical protein